MATVNANPLLLEWLKGIYELSKERGGKGVTTWKKAYESMKACPLTFSHPSEAQQLDGIGPKICDLLTKKLEEHCKTNGLPMPTKGKRKRQSGTENAEGAQEDDETPAAAKKPRKKKPYVPALRSGPYALVLALSSLPEDSLQSLSKAELQVLAQPYCDSSFTVPSEANKFYTAWSSMKTLVEKDLVQERGRPARRYNLSDEGWEVARRIKAVQAGKPANKASGSDTQEVDRNSIKGKPSRRPEPSSTDFLDLDDDFEWERKLQGPSSKARPGVSLDTAVGVTESRLEDQTVAARTTSRRGSTPPAQAQGPHSISDSNFVDLLSSPEQTAINSRPPETQTIQQNKTKTSTPFASSKPASTESSAPKLDNPSYRNESVTSFPAELPDLPAFDPITIAPGTFTVHLVLDTREVRTKSDRDYIHDELVKKGIKPILRALELGDFFWVAKLNNPSSIPTHGQNIGDDLSEELALDWIVERKRLDDLVGSIKDGRFTEQKFRLKKTGLKNVIYLIEEFTLGSEKESMHDAIQTAIASTQVVNGFFVKKTSKLDDTIRYIARLTTMLQQAYQTKPLYLIPSHAIDAPTYLPLLHHLRSHPAHRTRSYHLTYPTFAALASKTDNLTLRDVFVRMLMCVRGVSADKALAMQRLWPTPRALIEAFEACASERERAALVADKMAGAVGRAQVKRALSEKVAGIWGAGG